MLKKFEKNIDNGIRPPFFYIGNKFFSSSYFSLKRRKIIIILTYFFNGGFTVQCLPVFCTCKYLAITILFIIVPKVWLPHDNNFLIIGYLN